MKGGKGGLSFSIFLVSREWFRRERESDRPTVFHFPPRHSSFDSFSSSPIQPFSSHSISSPPLPSLPLSVRSLGTQGKKERRDGERENGRKCGKGGGGVAFLLLRPRVPSSLFAFLPFWPSCSPDQIEAGEGDWSSLGPRPNGSWSSEDGKGGGGGGEGRGQGGKHDKTPSSSNKKGEKGGRV